MLNEQYESENIRAKTQKCNVLQSNDNNRGSTGIAMNSAIGWNTAETAANSQQNIMESYKMEEVEIVLRIIKIFPFVPQDSLLLKTIEK